MIRSELCEVANIAVPTFNSHRRNGNLPFSIDQSEAKDGLGRTWARFTSHEAMLLIAAQNLASAQGVTWSEAAQILRETAIHTDRDHYHSVPGVHCARVEFRTVGGEKPFLHDQFQVYRGKLSQIIEAAERTVVKFNERSNFEADRIAVYSLISVNLSQAWYIAKQRAVHLGIDLSSDGAIDPLADS